MKRSSLHIALKIFTLCVMTLTSTGFTAIVSYCSMTESSECCCGEESSHMSGAPAAGVSLTREASPCFTRTIAGGLNNITATTSTDAAAHRAVPDVVAVDTYALSHTVHDRPLFFASVDNAAPPGVPIYIRVNSILI